MSDKGDTRQVLFHLDMDAFFVSVEELSDPSLKGKPVVVGGKPGERGVVAAASYGARRFGIRSAMPLRQAYRLCPQATFLEGRPHRYLDYSRRVKSILGRFSPSVEMASIDEAYLDMTGTERLLGPPMKSAHSLHEAVSNETGLPCSIGIGTSRTGAERLLGPPLRAAHDLHETVRQETQLPCSIGIGVSRLVAKICSGLAKPNGVLRVEAGCEAAFLAPLAVGRIPGVGKVMRRKLRILGINTIGQAQAMGEAALERHFGKHGRALAGKARGIDSGAWFSPGFGSAERPKSISHETTFREDTVDRVAVDATLAKLSQLVARRLREHGLWTRNLQVKIRYSNFTTHTRSKTLEEATQLDSTILEAVRSLFATHRVPGRAVRLLGVQAGSLQSGPDPQRPLFGRNHSQRWTRALQAVDALRDRYGESAVGLGGALGHARRERVHENPSGLAGSARERSDGVPDRD